MSRHLSLTIGPYPFWLGFTQFCLFLFILPCHCLLLHCCPMADSPMAYCPAPIAPPFPAAATLPLMLHIFRDPATVIHADTGYWQAWGEVDPGFVIRTSFCAEDIDRDIDDREKRVRALQRDACSKLIRYMDVCTIMRESALTTAAEAEAEAAEAAEDNPSPGRRQQIQCQIDAMRAMQEP